ncbi:hypothetical protein OSB04_011231 [Centaurea solstitialis]|uniref:Reverse transcriptase Ty1/copia-type domain-containing protein n=1 Tax=Centaurea solstitialis TaxID=347529 RepID=A0AA38TS40_9ASTR|nr:hypothetical protein OSB04_011231 [Centaurea solstitialis]
MAVEKDDETPADIGRRCKLENTTTSMWSHSKRTDHLQVDKAESLITSKFVMMDLGEVDMILGIRIKRVNKGIALTQSHYVEKVLKKFNYNDCSPVSTPMDPRVMIMPNKGLAVSQLEYSQALGCLMYAMISTRPDIAYAVGSYLLEEIINEDIFYLCQLSSGIFFLKLKQELIRISSNFGRYLMDSFLDP